MKLAIVIVHNKTALQNAAQITAVLNRVTPVTVTFTDPETSLQHTVPTGEYTINNLGINHTVRFYQVVPYGVNPPANYGQLNSHNVLYREGDNDKVSTHPRFFNWGLKRAVDFGADVVLYLDDITANTLLELRTAFQELADESNRKLFIELQCGKLVTRRVLRFIGQLDESKTLAQAITDLKSRITAGGYQNG